MNILLVEDEFMVAKRLKRFIEQALADEINTIHHYATLDDARDFLDDRVIDVLFLDLNLNGQNGFELLKQHISDSFHTIVVSANTDRAIEAFDIGVLDFIAKPFTYERVEKAIHRLKASNENGQCQYISYRHLGKIELLAIEEIAYLQAAGHYCEINTVDKQTILHDKTLDKLLKVLPDSFIRIHRSYAVPLKNIKALRTEAGSKYYVILSDETQLPIGRTRYKEIKYRLSILNV